MNWDYDKFFAEGNVIGVKSNSSDTFLTSAVDCDNIKDWKSAYGNEKLSNGIGDIQWIVRLDEKGEVTERVFDRERDFPKPMPELKTGMFVRVVDENDSFDDYGVIVNSGIVYCKGGWNSVDEEIPYIVTVWGNDVSCFVECKSSVYKPIWQK